MTEAEMKRLVDRHIAAERARDVPGVLATFIADCFLENFALGVRFTGKEKVGAQYAALFSAFPDGEAVYDGEAFGAEAYVHWGTLRGTMAGDFLGQAATGARIAVPVAAVISFRDGLIEGERVFLDLATLCEQARLPLARVRAAARALLAAR
jgi:steroid delta-isomerase-like uncharacterized protein